MRPRKAPSTPLKWSSSTTDDGSPGKKHDETCSPISKAIITGDGSTPLWDTGPRNRPNETWPKPLSMKTEEHHTAHASSRNTGQAGRVLLFRGFGRASAAALMGMPRVREAAIQRFWGGRVVRPIPDVRIDEGCFGPSSASETTFEFSTRWVADTSGLKGSWHALCAPSFGNKTKPGTDMATGMGVWTGHSCGVFAPMPNATLALRRTTLSGARWYRNGRGRQ